MNFAGMSSRKLALAGFLVCAGLIAFALYLQYEVNLEPCPLCMLQRLCFTALGLVFLIAFLHGPGRKGVRIYGALAFLIAATGIGLATRHVWLQWFPPLSSSCTADLFFQLRRFPFLSVIEKALRATGDCAKVDWRFLYLSIAEWSWVWFVLLTIFIVGFYARAVPRRLSMWR
ncbi:MAG: disulfide bond formation protein B [Burkholderiaceae bacterium]|jgi:disulfide bond formation protein DsbB